MNKINLAFEGTEEAIAYNVLIGTWLHRTRIFGSTDIPILLSWQARRFINEEVAIVPVFLNLTLFSHDISEIVGAGATVTSQLFKSRTISVPTL